ncbi:MAG: hypothetical protein HUK26_07190, partial [Duodenibacillus sp.]|nr:hypothetical protein [Duodenibacillus sp.]
ACAGIITQGERLARGGVAIVASIVVSSIVAMAVTAWVMQAVKRWQDRRAAGGRDAA